MQGTRPVQSFSLLALLGLALTACGGDGDASANTDAESSTEVDEASEPESPRLESGYFHQDFGQNSAVTDTVRPGDAGRIVTPSGTLNIESVETIDSVRAEDIGLEPVFPEPEEPAESAEEEDVTTDVSQMDPLDYVAAEGEGLRVITMSFDGTDDEAGYDVISALSVLHGGAQNHVADLSSDQSFRVLIAAAEDGSSQVVVSADGHDQHVNILTGEREDDEVAAGYYRQVTNQDLNHSLSAPTSTVDIVEDGSNAEGTDDYGRVYSSDLDFEAYLTSARLAGWAPGEGWATEGEAWLVLDWESTADLNFTHSAYGGLEELSVQLEIDADGETFQVEEHIREESGYVPSIFTEPTVSAVAVPISTTDVTVKAISQVGLTVNDSWYSVDPNTFELETDAREFTFPDYTNDGGSESATESDNSDETTDGDE